jgi:hypothetical protein
MLLFMARAFWLHIFGTWRCSLKSANCEVASSSRIPMKASNVACLVNNNQTWHRINQSCNLLPTVQHIKLHDLWNAHCSLFSVTMWMTMQAIKSHNSLVLSNFLCKPYIQIMHLYMSHMGQLWHLPESPVTTTTETMNQLIPKAERG